MNTKRLRLMTKLDLPKSTLVAFASDRNSIEIALQSVLGTGKERFTHMAMISGEQRSGRIMLMTSHPDAVPFYRGFTAKELAINLETDMEISFRYQPATPPDPAAVKGLEIRKAHIKGRPAAIIWASWMTR